ncbi:MAG: permease [Deltaproteobacteria bacterium]|jgi:cell division transport system permease protein|nr:permease [Deltaproteobacteria bacterium]
MIRMIARLIRQGIADLAIQPKTQILALLGVSLMTFLAGIILMALLTLNSQLSTVRGETAFQVYWHPGMDLKLVREQWDSFRQMPDFSAVATYTPDEALRNLGARLGRLRQDRTDLAGDFPFLGKASPLPATALVSFAPTGGDLAAWLERTENFLKNLPGVERVVTTPLRDELGQAWRKISRLVMLPSLVFLTLALGLLVGNTIRLALLTRASEIEILHMVGAYAWYIRFPLMTGGAVLGLAGGALALGMLRLVHAQIRDALNFPPLFVEIVFPPQEFCLALVLVPALTGMAASWLAVRG